MPKNKGFHWRKPKPPEEQQPPEQKDSEAQKEAHDHHGSIASRVELELGKHLKKQHEAEYDKTSTYNNWQLSGTFIAAGLIFVYTLVMLWQACLTRESFTAVQRAFVNFSPDIQPLYITNDADSEQVKSWVFAVPIRNSGATPTSGFKDRVFAKAQDKPISDDFSFQDFEQGERAVIGPHDQITYQTREPISSADMMMSEHGVRHVYLYGWALYRDVFKATHVTKFCYEEHAEVGDWTRAKSTDRVGRATLCPIHNCTDEDCGK